MMKPLFQFCIYSLSICAGHFTSLGQLSLDKATYTDTRDGKTYKTVRIGKQIWFAENFKYEEQLGSWCYGNSDHNCAEFGRLYNWETALKVCPSGWHLPGKEEWETLLAYLGGHNYKSFDKLIKGGSSGFEGLFGGYRGATYGKCYNLNEYGNFWSSSQTASGQGYAWFFYLVKQGRGATIGNQEQSWGCSVRYVKTLGEGSSKPDSYNSPQPSKEKEAPLDDLRWTEQYNNPVELVKEVIKRSRTFWTPLGYTSVVGVYTVGKSVAMYGGGYILLESPKLASDLITGGYYKLGTGVSEDLVLNIIEASVKTPRTLCRNISESVINQGLRDYETSYEIAKKYNKHGKLTRHEAIKFLHYRWGLFKLAIGRELYNESNERENSIQQSLAKQTVQHLMELFDKNYQKFLGVSKTLPLSDAGFFIRDLSNILESKKIGLMGYRPYLAFTVKMENLNKYAITEAKRFTNSNTAKGARIDFMNQTYEINGHNYSFKAGRYQDADISDAIVNLESAWNTFFTGIPNEYTLFFKGAWGGGNSISGEILLVNVNGDQIKKIAQISSSSDSPKIINLRLLVTNYRWSDGDARCCPSFKIITTLKWNRNNFETEKIEEQKMQY